MPWLRQRAVRQLPSGYAAIAFRLRKNLVSPNCEHDCENSPDQSSQVPYYLIARERLTRQRVLKPCLRRQIMEHDRIRLERVA